MSRVVLQRHRVSFAYGLFGLSLLAGPLMAQQVVRSASSATQTVGTTRSGPPGYSPTYAINQTGLFTGYTSGVTSWDTYFAGTPLHSRNASVVGEWWGFGATQTLKFDFGSTIWLSGIALWNEESFGSPRFSLLDGDFKTLLSNQSLTDRPIADYPADIFTFGAVSTRYLYLVVSDCTYWAAFDANTCALGEVAFREELGLGDPGLPGTTTPEPATVALMATGLVGLAGASLLRRRKQQTA